jgi:hypothetical protein
LPAKASSADLKTLVDQLIELGLDFAAEALLAILTVGNGPKAHHYFGRSSNRPKPVGFGEMARAYWTTGGSAVR